MIDTKSHLVRVNSSISWPLFAFVWGTLGFTFIFLVIAHVWLGVAVVFPIMGFVGHMYTNTYYTIDKHQLFIRCGMLYRQQIAISDIVAVTKTNDISSAPALDLKRLDVKYKKGRVIISPKDPDVFVILLRDAGGVFDTNNTICSKT